MTKTEYFSNQFLIAMPNLMDVNFSHTVSFLCQHDEEGALAIVINRLAGMTLGQIFQQMNISCQSKSIRQTPILAGGPMQQERGFIIHSPCNTKWDSSIIISEQTQLTSSRDILEAIAQGEGPENYLIALGYAGWGVGQLEQEIIDNSWLNSPYQPNILYQTPIPQRWKEAANQIGININKLTIPAGHA